MEKAAFIEKLKELTASEDILGINREVNELKAQFDDLIIEEERQRQVEYLEAKERGEDVQYESKIIDPLRDEFFAVLADFKGKRAEILKAQKAEEEKNYVAKRALIAQLKELIENEENIKTAYEVSKEIHEKWKSLGDVPREKRQEIQTIYSQLRDTFFRNLSIYKELRDYDFVKNQQIKEDITNRIKALLNEENIKKVEISLKALQNEFEEAGPVPNSEWEKVRDNYWENVRAVYQKIHDFYEETRTRLTENTAKKEALLATVENFVATKEQLNNPKKWEDATKKLLEFQQEWKNIGFGLREKNETLWHAFRAQCDLFFHQKSTFFDGIKATFEQRAKQKKALIEKINAVKSNTDWKETTRQIIDLQNQWKKIGHAGQRNEQTLWKEFRGACDEFFNAKDAHFKEAEAEATANLTAKKEIIERIKSYEAGEDKSQTLKDLKQFAVDFNLIGRVPFKEKETVYNEFKTALDAHYGKLKLEGQEKDKALFQAKLETIKSAPNASHLIEKEKEDIRRQIANLKSEVTQYENNLGFFSSSNNSSPILKDIHQKIKHSKERIENLKTKLKLFNE